MTNQNKTGFRGVKKTRDGRFEAWIRPDWLSACKIYCGSALTADDAARLYDDKARELFGEGFKFFNFPDASDVAK